MTTERCSCGAREKNKCSKEGEHGSGKICLKDLSETFLDAQVALDLIENPPAPNDKLTELLELK